MWANIKGMCIGWVGGTLIMVALNGITPFLKYQLATAVIGTFVGVYAHIRCKRAERELRRIIEITG